MPAWELRLYRLFVQEHGPIGDRRADWRMATLLAQNDGRGRNVEKFLLKFERQEITDFDDLTLEEQKDKAMNVAQSIMRQCGGRIKKTSLLTISFQKGELKKIKRLQGAENDDDGSESGG